MAAGLRPKICQISQRHSIWGISPGAGARGGAGLGLALAERIAALHGARLEFTSRVGEGTRAQVVFPVFFEETADAFTKDLQGDEDFAEGN